VYESYGTGTVVPVQSVKDTWLHSFSTSAQGESEWSAARLERFEQEAG
jgi:hypothetical protein